MSKKLNNWQTWALFLPFIAGIVIMNLPQADFYAYQTNFAIANLLFILNIFLAIGYQTYLVINFIAQANVKSGLFKSNALIPLIFSFVYLVYVAYAMFARHAVHSANNIHGPMPVANYNLTAWITLALLIHAFITFYFVNPWLVSGRIRTELDITRQEELTSQFLVPIKRLVRVSLWVYAILFVASILGDLVSFFRK